MRIELRFKGRSAVKQYNVVLMLDLLRIFKPVLKECWRDFCVGRLVVGVEWWLVGEQVGPQSVGRQPTGRAGAEWQGSVGQRERPLVGLPAPREVYKVRTFSYRHYPKVSGIVSMFVMLCSAEYAFCKLSRNLVQIMIFLKYGPPILDCS